MQRIYSFIYSIPSRVVNGRSGGYWLRSFAIAYLLTGPVAIGSWIGFCQFYKAIGFKEGPHALVVASMIPPIVPPVVFHAAMVRRLDKWEKENQ